MRREKLHKLSVACIIRKRRPIVVSASPPLGRDWPADSMPVGIIKPVHAAVAGYCNIIAAVITGRMQR